MTTPPKPEVLSEHAKTWLSKLPDDVRPKELPEQFPRIVNRLSSLWRHADELMEYLNDLLVDMRGDRQGFPMAVAMELANVKDYYETTVDPEYSKAYLWDPRRKNEPKKKR
jgi:hypothetical protein